MCFFERKGTPSPPRNGRALFLKKDLSPLNFRRQACDRECQGQRKSQTQRTELASPLSQYQMAFVRNSACMAHTSKQPIDGTMWFHAKQRVENVLWFFFPHFFTARLKNGQFLLQDSYPILSCRLLKIPILAVVKCHRSPFGYILKMGRTEKENKIIGLFKDLHAIILDSTSSVSFENRKLWRKVDSIHVWFPENISCLYTLFHGTLVLFCSTSKIFH